MPSTHLGIDFGTSHTVAALTRPDGSVEPLLFDGSPLLPSAVLAEEDGRLIVGSDALQAARMRPDRCEPHPKRRVDDGTVLLGEREYPVGDLFAAVLGLVRRRCVEVAGAVPPSVGLTHPASWGPTRRRVLTQAASAAGFPTVRLMPEPVAAARYYTNALHLDVPVGAAVAVHDFGGGTFDASVVRRTTDGFEVLSVDGLDNLGGVDIDHALIDHVKPGETAGAISAREEWLFREDARRVKESLSRRASAELYVPGGADVHVTREELDALAAPMLARAVTVTQAVVADSGVAPGELAGVFLVGGASRMPLVATLLHRALGVAPVAADDLEQVVVRGSMPDGRAPAPVPVPPMVPAQATPVSAPPVAQAVPVYPPPTGPPVAAPVYPPSVYPAPAPQPVYPPPAGPPDPAAYPPPVQAAHPAPGRPSLTGQSISDRFGPIALWILAACLLGVVAIGPFLGGDLESDYGWREEGGFDHDMVDFVEVSRIITMIIAGGLLLLHRIRVPGMRWVLTGVFAVGAAALSVATLGMAALGDDDVATAHYFCTLLAVAALELLFTDAVADWYRAGPRVGVAPVTRWFLGGAFAAVLGGFALGLDAMG
ncbi:Hsp70 family protein [Phytomonospora endophytica]|uniref:Actin-like ATPase involved in cell morphogenesis n=1 Tax=Phytomonospora endophytica TaxID=714109 RepID=A0A841G0W3_9ACTN|nr:Hsp70 family protein [Phytomonospora endophytica]MBB6039297.1 actin-like ATPase involved in cell morphogenesis [Phytomonospora endophytica]GIG69761.1 hypothetical protein Pen01_60560 [Phytomonospora endophytica]